MKRVRNGFTLVEIVVSMSVLAIALTVGMSALVYVLRGTMRGFVQNEIDMDVQTAMERLKRDLRLSSMEKIVLYPTGATEYKAISFPLAKDNDGDGAVEMDADGKIIWDQTVVYHVWSGDPEQLRVTTFEPRDNTLTDSQVQQQLASVVTKGNGKSTYGATSTTTRVLFENLFSWSITPERSTFDGYSSTQTRVADQVLGNVVLTPGSHKFRFTVKSKNPYSTGYKLGIDSLFVSASGGRREGEAQLPATASSGATPVASYMAGGSWDGNYQLLFPGTAVNQYFELTLENDRWEETNFRGNGSTREKTVVVFDQTLSPYDFVVMLEGNDISWSASQQTGNLTGEPLGFDILKGSAIRVLLRGEQMLSGNWFQYSGGRCKINFRSGATFWEKLKIEAAYIAECADTTTPSMDAVSGTMTKLTFGGAGSVTIDGNSDAWSDLVDMPIEKEKSYLVSFLVANGLTYGNTWKWNETINPSLFGTFIIPSASLPSDTDVKNPTWSSRADVRSTNAVLAVQHLFTTYPTNGLFTSMIYDTAVAAPAYSEMLWNSVVPSGASLEMKVRTGNQADLSDAAGWDSIAAKTSPGSISPGDKRYVQFQARLKPDSTGVRTPRLQDVTVRWPGETTLVNVGGTFTRGPDYGLLEVSVDGTPLTGGLSVYLSIFKQGLGMGGNRTYTSALKAQILPRNTGK